jgi:hypothetical protein
MARRPAITEILDDAEELTARVMAPWGGVLWLSLLPLRLAQIHLLDRLVVLGDEVGQYGDHVRDLALTTTAALLLALVGRAVYARACTLGLRRATPPGAEALRLGLGPALGYLYVGLVLEAFFLLSLPLLVFIPLFAVLSGLAAATSPLHTRPALFAPWVTLGARFRHPLVLAGLFLVFFIAWMVAYLNLFVLFYVGAWLAQAWPGFDPGLWGELLGLRNRSFHLLLGAGALLAIEPFWLAACVVFAQMSVAHTTGEDLRIRWARLRAVAHVPAR